MDPQINGRRPELRLKANRLPLRPGVYIMKNSSGKVIYVGKSKALRNRVSQYFAETSRHDIKTQHMVASVYDFDYMPTDTEIEALALENKLIKLYMPKYNINLKDGKSYPYIKVSFEGDYPSVKVTRKRSADKAKYFGPYSGVRRAYDIVETLRRIFSVPSCGHVFPRDAGKVKPCMYSRIGQCCAPCRGGNAPEEYKKVFDDIVSFLGGRIGEVKHSLEAKMNFAAENLMFEAAAAYRDRIQALERLWDKQKVVGAPDEEYDVIAFYEGNVCSCLGISSVREGVLLNGDNVIFGADRITDADSIASLLCEFYSMRDYIPKRIILGFDLGEENTKTVEEYISTLGTNSKLLHPEKGKRRDICNLVYDGAKLHAEQYAADSLRDSEVLVKLAQLLRLEVVPESIEAVDISNLGDEAITAGIVSYVNGKPDKKGYRTYKIRGTERQDDYISMREAISRRISHADKQPLPDLLLLDGGKGHVSTIRGLFEETGTFIPVFGMVKDEFHKTRTLTDGRDEIDISGEQSVFTLIYKIQEEVHRFTVSGMMRRKTHNLTSSQLTKIKGIGEKKAALLLHELKSIKAIKAASVAELAAIKGISNADASAIYNYFNSGESQL